MVSNYAAASGALGDAVKALRVCGAAIQGLEDERAALQAKLEPVVVEPPIVVDPPIVVTDPHDWGLDDADIVEDAVVGEPLEVALQRLMARAPSPPPGSVLALRLPEGEWAGLDIASGSAHASTWVPGWWGASELRLVGVGMADGVIRTRIDPRRGKSGGQTISIGDAGGRGNRGGSLGLYGVEVALAGRAAIHVNTGDAFHLVARGLQLVDCAEAVAEGATMLWGIHSTDCSFDVYGLGVHIPNAREHGMYPHGLGTRPSIITDMVLTACGGQVIQCVERQKEQADRPAQQLTIQDLVARGFHRNAGRAGSALTFAGAGLRVRLEECNLVGGVDGGLSQGLVATWTPEADDESYAEEDPTQLGFGNVSLEIDGGLYRVEGDPQRQVMRLTDCAEVRIVDAQIDSSQPIRIGDGWRGVRNLRIIRCSGTAKLEVEGGYQGQLAGLDLTASKIGKQPKVSV